MPELAELLREHRRRLLAAGLARPDGFVFASRTGGPLQRRNVVRRGLDKAAKRAGLATGDTPHLRFHDLRHTYASLLIAQGLNVVFVSRQLGHATPAITLAVYAHLFDHAQHAQAARNALQTGFGAILVKSKSSNHGNAQETDGIPNQAQAGDSHHISEPREQIGSAVTR